MPCRLTRIRGRGPGPGERQHPGSPVEGPDGGLFVDAEHGDRTGRVEVEPDDVGGLGFRGRGRWTACSAPSGAGGPPPSRPWSSVSGATSAARIDHLRATTRRSPRQASVGGPGLGGAPEDSGGAAHRYLLLYDTVPSGTGYLKELMTEPGEPAVGSSRGQERR